MKMPINPKFEPANNTFTWTKELAAQGRGIYLYIPTLMRQLGRVKDNKVRLIYRAGDCKAVIEWEQENGAKPKGKP